MLEVSFIRVAKEAVIRGLHKRGFRRAEEAIASVLHTDQRRRQLQIERDKVMGEANKQAKKIGLLMKEGEKQEAEVAKQSAGLLKEQSKKLSRQVSELEADLVKQLYQIPNLPHALVPEGLTAEDNEVVLENGKKPDLPEHAPAHWELAKKYQLIDFELGNKVSGAGFPFYTGKGARLQRALINFFLDQAAAAGYREIQPPVLVNKASVYATGQLPDKEGQMYRLVDADLYLIPTAEVPITNIFRNEIIHENKLPIKMVGFTPCFRREAGSWGTHVRGLNRLHQFDKVELVQIAHPDCSHQALNDMCTYIEQLLTKLSLPYRKVCLCGGDIGFNAALCYDMEVYSGAQRKWLEVSSASNFATYQSNRLKLRYSSVDNQKALAHTLNASALALPRIVAAILENNQTKDGILVPQVLHSYCGFEVIKIED